jgi:AcrR family transcriptional regulator
VGANGGVLSREGVAEIQRARILVAMTELVRERGVAGVLVAHVVDRSGVSRRTFYELFEDREDCFAAAFEQAVERARAIVVPVYAGEGMAGESSSDAWARRVRAGLGALLRFLDEEPALGGLCIVDALAAEKGVLERRACILEALVDAVHRGGAPARGGSGRRPRRIVAEGAVGAVFAIVHARMRERDPKPLAPLLNQLMGMIVLPYLGPEIAARESKRPAPRRRHSAAAAADPLRSLDMRLTYRTVRVLLAISETGGRGSVDGGASTNREVGDAAGISDQGQTSKLLWRLEHLGLIANGVERRGRGEANAWSLTPRGRELERVIRAQTGHTIASPLVERNLSMKKPDPTTSMLRTPLMRSKE